MRLRTLAIVAMTLGCGCALAGPSQPTGPRLWTRADLDSISLTLERNGTPYTQILKGKTHGVLLMRRTASGEAELHERLNDFFVVLTGQGEVEVDGRVSGERTVAPDEKRGEKLVGGTLYRVRQGDVLFVPANHWLQVLVAKGEVLRAIIIKTN